jgi:desulfoferrodoxin-like iron-binding protein
MIQIDNYLDIIQEAHEPLKGDSMTCNICKRKVHVLNNGKGPLICCGKPMVKSKVPITEAGFTDKPKGWNDSSIKKYSKTFTKKMKGNVKSTGFFDKCVKKMKGKMENPEGFCASLKDEAYGSTYWRGKDKKPKEVKKDVSKHQNV